MATEHSAPRRRIWRPKPLDILIGLVFIASGLTLAALQHTLPLWLQTGLLVAIGLLVIFPARAGNGKGGTAK